MISCFCLTVPTYGLLSSIGLFQTYWHRHVLRDHSEGDISWIISVFGFLNCLFAAPSGILFDRYGSRWLLPLGCGAYIAAFIGLAFSTTYGQFMGCLALAGACFPFTADKERYTATPTTIAFSVVSQWFRTRTGIATGCVTLGAPLGGILFSLTLQTLFDRLPWRAAALVLAGLMAGFLLLGCLLVETNVRIPEQTASEDDSGSESVKVPGILASRQFWLISYAIFGERSRYTKRAVSCWLSNTAPGTHSVRACPLHPMGFYPFVCRSGKRWGYTVLLDDVVQHVGFSPSFWRSSSFANSTSPPAVVRCLEGLCPRGYQIGRLAR